MIFNFLNSGILAIGAFIGILVLELQDVHALPFCKMLGCANNSSCRTTVTNNLEDGSHVTHSECICHGGWVGAKCDRHLSLKIEYIKGHVAKLTTDVTAGNDARASKPKQKITFSYSYNVQYWSNETGSQCNIMTNLKSKRFTVTGLSSGRQYIVCASAVTIELCYKDKDTLSNSPNCVIMNTMQNFNPEVGDADTHGVVAPVSLTVFFVIVLVIVVVVVMKCRTAHRRRSDFAFRNLLRPATTCPCLSKWRKEPTEEPQTNSRLLPDYNQMSTDRAIGPYGQQRRHNKRTHAHTNGSASYATCNDVRIPLTTIIEYTPEQTLEIAEGSSVITEKTTDIVVNPELISETI